MNPWHILGWFLVVVGSAITILFTTAVIMAIRITNDQIRKEKGLDK
jgi:hypothetical protein